MSHHHCNKCGKKIDNNRHNSAIKVDFVGENPKNININLKRVNKSIHATNIVAKTKPVGKIEDKEIIRQNQKTRSSVIPNKNKIEILEKQSDRVPYSENRQKMENSWKYNKEKNNLAAILVKIEDDIEIGQGKNSEFKNRIFFTIGICNNHSFRVIDDGSGFLFDYSGLYRIVFTGKTDKIGKIDFERKPDFNKKQRNFSIYDFGDEVSYISTMLPFKSGSTLNVKFYPEDNSTSSILYSGAQLEIYRVDNM
jgi:hypothetical protein